MITLATPGSFASGSTRNFSAMVVSWTWSYCSPDSASHITACASESRLATTGSSISSGSRLRARATRSRTSLAAASRSRPSSNSTEICETCSRLSEVTTLTPSMPFTWSSRTSVTEVSTTSGAAPGNTVVTETIGGSIDGSSRLVSRSRLIPPKSRITSDITVASTGRSMQISAILKNRTHAARRRAARRGPGRSPPARPRAVCGLRSLCGFRR